MNMFKSTTAKTPEEYIETLEEPRKSEIKKLHEFIKKAVPDLEPFIINGMIGYGKMHYKGKTSKGEWCTIGLAPQKNYISIYLCVAENGGYLAEKRKDVLGKASIGKSCIRYKKVEDIPLENLGKVLQEGADIVKKNGTLFMM